MIVAATFLTGFINLVLLLLGLFLILLVLIQRGKGGGLAGAFGGMGGSSAFGARADGWTRFTIVIAAVWFFLIMIEIRFVQPPIQRTPTPMVTPTGGANPTPPDGQ